MKNSSTISLKTDNTPVETEGARRATGVSTGGATSAVGCFPGGVSPYGCEEMSGNVWEWTRSLWGKSWSNPDFMYPYKPNDGREKLSGASDILRVVRGGSFLNNHRNVRCSSRYWYYPGGWDAYVGFRVMLSPFISER